MGETNNSPFQKFPGTTDARQPGRRRTERIKIKSDKKSIYTDNHNSVQDLDTPVRISHSELSNRLPSSSMPIWWALSIKSILLLGMRF